MNQDDTVLNERQRLDFLTQNNPNVLRNLLAKPRELLQQLGLSEKAFNLPSEALAALHRATALTEKVKSTDKVLDLDFFPELLEIIREGFGQDFKISKEPFGIRFSEEPPMQDYSRTYTGTISFPWIIIGHRIENIAPDGDE